LVLFAVKNPHPCVSAFRDSLHSIFIPVFIHPVFREIAKVRLVDRNGWARLGRCRKGYERRGKRIWRKDLTGAQPFRVVS
jgi:hypothetical protein